LAALLKNLHDEPNRWDAIEEKAILVDRISQETLKKWTPTADSPATRSCVNFGTSVRLRILYCDDRFRFIANKNLSELPTD